MDVSSGPVCKNAERYQSQSRDSDAGVKTGKVTKVRHEQSNRGQDKVTGVDSGGWRRKDKVGNWLNR